MAGAGHGNRITENLKVCNDACAIVLNESDLSRLFEECSDIVCDLIAFVSRPGLIQLQRADKELEPFLVLVEAEGNVTGGRSAYALPTRS